MKPLTRVLVERLRAGVMSRNRHYRFFRRPEGTEALRIHRYLRSVEKDLLGHAREPQLRVEVQEEVAADSVTLAVEIPSLGARRTCLLTRTEFSLLLSNPRVLALLRERG